MQHCYGALCENTERVKKYMEENIVKNDENLDSVKDQMTPPGAKEKENVKPDEANKDNGADKESVTLTKAELDKRIQSAEDKLRTSYTKTIKELEGKIKELSPVEKSDTELELERRLSELEKAQKELDAQKAFLELQDTLQSKGIDKSIATYLKEGVDVDELVSVFQNVMKEATKSNAYVPDSHNAGDKISADEWKNMRYSEKAEIKDKNPELYKRLMAKFKK